jgi:hypothetical protein
MPCCMRTFCVRNRVHFCPLSQNGTSAPTPLARRGAHKTEQKPHRNRAPSPLLAPGRRPAARPSGGERRGASIDRASVAVQTRRQQADTLKPAP